MRYLHNNNLMLILKLCSKVRLKFLNLLSFVTKTNFAFVQLQTFPKNEIFLKWDILTQNHSGSMLL